VIALDLAGIAASSGSACASGSNRPSHVLAALGFTTAQAAGALRFSLGRGITAENITFVVEKMTEIVQRVRSV
jgi:cysteine desulfurase